MKEIKTISVLGSTGSIGRQTLDVALALGVKVNALTAGTNVELMEEQARQFKPSIVAMANEEAAAALKARLKDTDIKVTSSKDAHMEAAQMSDAAVCAVSGVAALEGVLWAAQSGCRLALANKEALVCAGSLIKNTASRHGAEIIPVDSEHSAIFQCLQGNTSKGEIRKLILTASGGPFWGKTFAELENVTAAQALKHPNWAMGQKITIDSATMMNKGLEIIEAMRLYDLPREKIGVLIHRQSIVHSLVEYCDGALLAQLGQPDMRLPIQYALTYPHRGPMTGTPLDLSECADLSFAKPDEENFPCLAIAGETASRGEIACTAMNAANEVAVDAFIKGKIGFNDISRAVRAVTDSFGSFAGEIRLEDVLEADRNARELAEKFIEKRR